MNKAVLIPVITLCFILIDWYAFQGVKWAFHNFSQQVQRIVFWSYWSITFLTISGFLFYHFGRPDLMGKHFSTFILLGIFTNYVAKIFIVLFVLIDDIQRIFRWVYERFHTLFYPEKNEVPTPEQGITRSEFLAKVGLITAAVPVVAISWGIVSGAHDYRIRRKDIVIPNLPKALDGIRIGQISDIHSGSFWNKRAVQGGIEMMQAENTDLLFFTGDLVNNRANEMSDYMNIFDKLSAPLGVYSIFGNHDYGDYVRWESQQQKQLNLNDLAKIHERLGWKLLRNKNVLIPVNNEVIAVLGVENWSDKARFPKYGNLQEAMQGADQSAVKILLSHDPSHWMAEVVQSYPEIDLTLAGHTHGMQFGVEISNFKWSPVQYMYKEWAGHYTVNNQHLYVNRGFGYLGYPGRIGIPPELTVLTLKSA